MPQQNISFMIGKTIESVDNTAVNSWLVRFTDGGAVELNAENAIYTEAGVIPGIFAEYQAPK
jgi:hypothetical protein